MFPHVFVVSEVNSFLLMPFCFISRQPNLRVTSKRETEMPRDKLATTNTPLFFALQLSLPMDYINVMFSVSPRSLEAFYTIGILTC